MEAGLLAVLSSPTGQAALALAVQVVARDPLAAAEAVRAAGFPADLAAAALTQAVLRRRAEAKFGPDAARMFYTRTGLEQASRAVVARRRADRLHQAGVRSCADLGCGLGADSIALARAGIRVRAVERDPATARIAAVNLAALGLADAVEVMCADATGTDLSDLDGVFCDPARRTGHGRVFHPRSFSPPWDALLGFARQVPRTVAKLGPGLPHAMIPTGTEAEWVSVHGDLVEVALWFGPLAAVPRRATLLRATGPAELTGTGDRTAAVGPVRRYVCDPDPAVVRAHLVAEFASTVDGTLVDPRIAYTFTDHPADTPYARCFEVLDRPPFARKRLRAALREADVGALEIRMRGIGGDPDQIRRELRPAGSVPATLLLTRIGDTPTALLCRPVPVAGPALPRQPDPDGR